MFGDSKLKKYSFRDFRSSSTPPLNPFPFTKLRHDKRVRSEHLSKLPSLVQGRV